MEAVGNWAEKRNLPYAGYTDLAQKPEVYELVRDCVEKVNADLAADAMLAGSQISRFLILHKELDADDGELTRTRKVQARLHRRALPGAGRRAVRRQDEPVHRDAGEVRGRAQRRGQRRR